MSTSEKAPASAAAPAPAPTTALATIDQPRWTPERQSAFLHALASTHSVTQAARAAGMSRQSAYALRARLKGEPFDLAWHAALKCRMDALADVALDRAMHGVEVPHFYKGELIHTSRRFDERLTVALLAMRERFGPPRVPSTHLAFAYRDNNFGPLVERVEQGPETWDKQWRLEFEECHSDESEDEEGA